MIRYSFTVDMDWAPREVVEYTLSIFREYGVAATLFMTDQLESVDLAGHEAAIHPHFEQGRPYEQVMDDLLKFAPGAAGVRPHSLFHSQRLIPLYEQRGFRYDSSVMKYNEGGIRPYRLTPSLWEIPIFFMDNVHLWMHGEGKAPFTLDALDLETPGLRVFAFHPVHIYLNTETMDRYSEARRFYKEPARLREYENPESSGRGTRVLLRRLLAQAAERRVPVARLCDLCGAV